MSLLRSSPLIFSMADAENNGKFSDTAKGFVAVSSFSPISPSVHVCSGGEKMRCSLVMKMLLSRHSRISPAELFRLTGSSPALFCAALFCLTGSNPTSPIDFATSLCASLSCAAAFCLTAFGTLVGCHPGSSTPSACKIN
jgi:hypothetical protein